MPYELEERIMFDGAAVADVEETEDAQAAAAAAAEAEDAVEETDSAEAESSEADTDNASGTDEALADDASGADGTNAVISDIAGETNPADRQSVQVLLISSLIENADDLAEAAGDDVIVIPYDAEITSLDQLLDQIQNELGDRDAASIGIVTDSDSDITGSVKLTANETLTADSITSDTEQTAFFQGLDNILTEDGSIDFFTSNLAASDSGNNLIQTIEDITGNNVNAADNYFDSEISGNFNEEITRISELYIVDRAVRDFDRIISGVPEGSEIVYLDNDSDGVVQITDALQNYTNLDAIHLITEGSRGVINVGNSFISEESIAINEYAENISSWGNSLSENGDILIYACSAAEGEIGADFIGTLADLTGADIAASTNITGGEAFSGNWYLEYPTGLIETASLTIEPDIDIKLAVITWDGSESTVWTLGDNWAGGVAPIAGDSIIIPDAATTNNDPDLSVNTAWADFTVQAGGILNFVAGGVIDITGSFTNNGTVNAAGAVNISIVADGNINLNGDITSATGDVTLDSGVAGIALTGATTITSTSGAITFSDIIDGGQTLEIAAGAGNIVFSGTVGGTTPIGVFTLTSGNLDTTGQNISAAGITVNGETFNSASAAGTWVVSGDVAIAAGAALNATSGSFTVGGNWTNNATGTFVDNSGLVTFNATTGTIEITPGGTDANHDFYNITFNDAGGNATYQLQGALDVNNDLTITDGILDTKSGSNYAITVARDFLQNAGRCTAQSSTITVGRHFTANGAELSTQYNSATLVLTGAGNLTYSNLTALYDNGFYNLTCGQSGNITTIANQFSIGNILTVGSGTLTGGSYALYIKGENPLSFNAASTLTIGGLRFLRAGSQSIPTLINGYGCNIRLAGNNNVVTQTGHITLNSNKYLLIDGDGYPTRSCTWVTDGYNLTVGGYIQVGAGNDTGLKTLNASSGAGGTTTITVGGNWTVYSTGTAPAVFTAGNSTVIFNGAADQTVSTGGDSFYNLTLNNIGSSGSDDIIISGALDVNGLLKITDGDLEPGANNITIGGGLEFNDATNGSITRGAGTLTFDGTGAWTDSRSTKQDLGAVIIDGSSATLTLGSSVKATSITIGADDTLNLGAGSYTLELTGTGTPLTATGTFNKGTGSTVNYTGSGTATNVTTVAYHNLTFTPTSATTYSLTGDLTSGNALSGNLTINSNATLDTNSKSITVGGTTVINGILLLDGASAVSTLTISNTLTNSVALTLEDDTNLLSIIGSGAVRTFTGNDIDYNTNSVTLTNIDYDPDVSLDEAGDTIVLGDASCVFDSISIGVGNVASTFNAGANAFSLSGNFTNTATGIFNSTGTVTFAGTTKQQLTSGGDNFTNITVNNTFNGVNLELQDNTTVTGTLKLTDGAGLLDTNGNTLIVNGAIQDENGNSGKDNFDADHMIITDDTNGKLQRAAGADGEYLFPIGTNNGTAEYSPATLTFAGGTYAAGSYAEVTSAAAKYAENTSITDYLDRYWTVTSSGITNFSCDADFYYLAGDVVGAEASIYGGVYSNNIWTKLTLVNPATNSFTANDITSFSTFTGINQSLDPDPIPTPPTNTDAEFNDSTDIGKIEFSEESDFDSYIDTNAVGVSAGNKDFMAHSFSLNHVIRNPLISSDGVYTLSNSRGDVFHKYDPANYTAEDRESAFRHDYRSLYITDGEYGISGENPMPFHDVFNISPQKLENLNQYFNNHVLFKSEVDLILDELVS